MSLSLSLSLSMSLLVSSKLLLLWWGELLKLLLLLLKLLLVATLPVRALRGVNRTHAGRIDGDLGCVIAILARLQA
jgi:hypothetical protein